MDDATQFPESMDQNSGAQADSPSGSRAHHEEPAPTEAAHTETSTSGVSAAELAMNAHDAIEIEWEAEVEAFVKAEAEKAAVASQPANDDVTQPGEAAFTDDMGESRPDSADVALGFESACHCFAGAIGGKEAPASEESIENASFTAEAAPQESSLPLAELEPSPEANFETPAATVTAHSKPVEDRRKRRRAMISAPVRVRGLNVTNDGPDEISTTIDVSRNGILFVARTKGYYKGMDVAVIFPYSGSPTAIHAEQCGRVVRIETLVDGRMAVALALGIGEGEDLIDACGKKLDGCAPAISLAVVEPAAKKPLVLVMDPEEHVRVSAKSYLESEGYEVIAVANVVDASHVLDILQPALVLAEIEGEGLPGEGMPGYDLCVHIKETARFKRIPVVLTTRSGYPSDYSNAHALGAIVCMAKPYKQERLGHVVRLLVPLPTHKEAPAAAGCKPDPKRKACAAPHAGAGRGPLPQKKYDENTSLRRKSRFGSFR